MWHRGKPTVGSKLLNNLKALADVGKNLAEGLKFQKEDADKKRKEAELKVQEANREIEGKISQNLTENEKMKKE